MADTPLTIQGFDPDRSSWLGKWQTEPCSRCLRDVNYAEPHECTLDYAAHANHSAQCRWSVAHFAEANEWANRHPGAGG